MHELEKMKSCHNLFIYRTAFILSGLLVLGQGVLLKGLC